MPPFDRIPDPIVAAAFGETFLPAACKAVLGESYPTEPGVNPGFPPEPAELLCITGTYLHPERGLAENYATLSASLPSKRQILDLYSSTVARRQALMPRLLEWTVGMTGLQTEIELKETGLAMIRKTGHRLVAAHIIGRIASTGNLADALIVPTSVSEGIPIEVRHSIAPHAANLLPDDPKKETLKPFLSVDAEGREAASIVAACFLPSLRVMQRALAGRR